MLIQELLQLSAESQLNEGITFKNVEAWEKTFIDAAQACKKKAHYSDDADDWKDTKRAFSSFESKLEKIGEQIGAILEKQVPWDDKDGVDVTWDSGIGGHDFDFEVTGQDGNGTSVHLYISVEGNDGSVSMGCSVVKGDKRFASKDTDSTVGRLKPGFLVKLLDELNKGIQKLQKEWEKAPMISPQGKK